ncbi:hypothetical protein F0163_29245, partial [Klebsiella pneumoniae]|nr:hypothetical protein [Klebsiella pneumoniae]MDT9654534.1 hypothetical protein [Klebsiella pneumoniae]
VFHRISSCSVIPKIAYSDMLHQHQVTPLLTLRYLQYLCELTQPRRHPRIQRDDIAAQEIDPALKAFGRHIARSIRKGRGVHIPA